jgi:alpha-D-xyloside xylohydrolase
LATDKTVATLSTARLQVRVDLATGAVSFFDASGQPILAEKTGSRAITPAEVQGEKTFHVSQQWEANADESLYGLGQLQFGTVDIKGYDLDLWQHNTCVVVPLLVSSRGYGVFWDNISYTRFGDLRLFEPIPADNLIDATGQPGGLTTGTFTTTEPDGSARWRLPPPASINSAPTQTAASKCGWMENSSLTTGGKAG